MVFGVQEVLTIQESYTIWQKNMYDITRYSIFCIERNYLQPLNELDR